MSDKKIEIKCPVCEKKFLYYSSEERPFCSHRCRMVDLGLWLNESYAVPSKEVFPYDEFNSEELEEDDEAEEN